jgi:hypothetical protein
MLSALVKESQAKQAKIKAATQARCRLDGERLPEGTFVTPEGLRDATLLLGDFHSMLAC